MIIGFEQITANLPPVLIKTYAEILSLKFRDSVDKAIKNAELARYLAENGHSVKEAEIRQVIHYIRVNYRFTSDLSIGYICATSNGYFLSFDRNKLEKYKESLRQRWQSIKEVYDYLQI